MRGMLVRDSVINSDELRHIMPYFPYDAIYICAGRCSSAAAAISFGEVRGVHSRCSDCVRLRRITLKRSHPMHFGEVRGARVPIRIAVSRSRRFASRLVASRRVAFE